jgi:cytochrome c oxidase cbb3-type subunit 1
LVNYHFWLATIGIVLYASSMWVSGIMEGLMWRAVDAQGFLVNSFADTVAAKFALLVTRGTGGLFYLTGALIMAYNLRMTMIGAGDATPKQATTAVPAE